MDLYGEFAWRGMIYDATEGLKERFAEPDVTAYIGFDPTAQSLHVGNLLPILALARLQRCGHHAIAVVGGGTGLIGDPSGKTAERQLQTAEQVDANVERVRAQLSRFLDFDAPSNPARLVDNAEWLTPLGAIEFMRDIGKHFTVNHMLAKESVRRRVESEDGISYTEFSYLLLQAYDFLELHRRYNCTVQMGGSDQWGNITAGIDLIRKVAPGSPRANGLVMPLVTTASGAKFGKTEAGAIWLDPSMTTPYEFHQFWFNTEDLDAVKYLKFFTFLEQPRVAEIESAAALDPGKRFAQRELAREVTRLVHGEAGLREAETTAETLFRGDLSAMSPSELARVLPSLPSKVVAYQPDGWRVPALMAETGLTSSIGEGTRLIKASAVHVNGRLFTDEKVRLGLKDAIAGEFFVIRKGKRDHCVIRVGGVDEAPGTP